MMRRLIRASAGSGKTFQLSGHYLQQLFLGQSPETILATTFTRKAAGEILGRVLLRLAAAASDAAAAAELAQFLRPTEVTQQTSLDLLVRVTRDLHRLRVCTLDSFFQLVARSLSLELGLSPGWSIIDEHVDADLRQQAIDAVLAQHLPRDAQHLMQLLARGRSKRSVRDLIDDSITDFYELYLLTTEDAWNRFPRLQRLTQDERERALRDLYASELPADARAIAARAGDVERFQAGQWEAFVTKGLAGKVFAGDLKYYGKPLSADFVSACERLLRHARAELIEQLAQQTRATWDLISRFDREYTRLRNEHGWMRFSDVTRILARSENVADSSRMNFRLDSSIHHLLLDEFQDTSPDQWKVLKRLALRIADGQSDSSFFCVGDGKQAIYGWRGGVAGILDAVETTVPGITPETLDQSRRSSPAVIETVNRVFQLISRHSNLEEYEEACVRWATEFPPHSTAYPDRPGCVQLRTSPALSGDTAEEQRGPWYRWVADQIRDLQLQSPGATIGVLTRRNATVARLVHELALIGVPASEEGGTPPVDSPAVLAIMSLLHLTSHPGCQVSAFHVARSPLSEIVGLSPEHNASEVTAVALRLRGRLIDQGYGPTMQWLSESVRPFCSQRDLLRLQQITAAGWQFDGTPSLNPVDFVRLLENSRFQRSEPAPVRVMTVHQSKGLEFDVVVLPELDQRLFRPPSAAAGMPSAGEPPDHVSIWRNKELRSLLPEALQQAFRQTTARELSEALCLLYVAMTRSIYGLHLLMPPVTASRTPRTFAGLLLASLTEDQSAPPDTVLYQAGDPLWFRHILEMLTPRRMPCRDTAAERPEPVRLAPMPDGRQRRLARRAPSRHESAQLRIPSGIDSGSGSGTLDARTRGTLVHAWFECIEWLQPGQVPDSQQLREIAAHLAVPEALAESLIGEFLEVLARPWLRSVLTRGSAAESPAFSGWRTQLQDGSLQLNAVRERPFVLLENSVIVQGTIDRLVLATLGERVVAADILDFKTDRLVGDPAEWIAAKQSEYGPQLAEYRQAVQKCFDVSPRQVGSRLILLDANVVVTA